MVHGSFAPGEGGTSILMNDMRALSNAELFLQKYRILEGMLEKRYEGEKVSSPSVVIEYIRDADSEPVRTDLDLLREIRNILSHMHATMAPRL